METLTEVLELDTVELGLVVSDNRMWEAKATDDVADNKVNYFFHRDCGKGLGFRPFGKVINCNDGVLRATFG